MSHVIADSVSEAELGNFTAVKLKCGPGVEKEARRVIRLAERVPGAALRLDFNGCLDAARYARFLKGLTSDVRERIDFIEDPMQYDAANWRALPDVLSLAVDRGSDTATDGFAYRVLKPAVQETRAFTEPVVITSSMDHPLGQVFAAHEAATYQGVLHGAGLLTHWCFEGDVFSERLTVEGGRLRPPSGTGLGFDDLLEGLPWTRL